MGLFKIFKKSEPKKTKEITMDSLEIWLERFVDDARVNAKISILKRDISSKITRLNELLHELESSRLRDEKVVPDRLKSIFEGNKKAFLEKVRIFLLELKIPENREEIDEYLEKLSAKLNSLSEDTQKNYFVLKEFVEDQVRPVISKIKDIDNLVSNARAEFDRTPLTKIREIRALHKKYYFLLNELESISKELEHTVLMKKSELDRKAKFDSKIDELKNTKSYEEYQQLLARKTNIKDSIIEAEREIKELFSKIDYALKKRLKVTQDAMLEKYTHNPVEAIIEDSALKVIGEIVHIKNNIKELTLKKEKRDSILSSIEEAGEEKLVSLRTKLVSLREELDSILTRLKDNHYERSLKEREHFLESVSKNIEAIEKKEQDIENLMERMNPKYVKQKIKDLLRLIDEEAELK